MTTPGFAHMIIALTKSASNYAELMEDAMSRYVRPIQPITWLALCVALLLGANTADAQDSYPSKPIQVVVATAAGGAADTMGRLLGERLSEQMQQPIVVINQAGANGGIAAAQVARAAPDGYTLLLAIDTNLLVNPLLYSNLPYEPFRDFAPISQIARVIMTFAVPPSGPNTLQEFIAKAKANPGKLNYGSVGVGSTHHLGTERFKILTNIDIVHVPYKGTTPANTDLLAGVIDMIPAGVGVANPLLKSRQDQGARDCRGQAIAANAGCADDGRSGRSRL